MSFNSSQDGSSVEAGAGYVTSPSVTYGSTCGALTGMTGTKGGECGAEEPSSAEESIISNSSSSLAACSSKSSVVSTSSSSSPSTNSNSSSSCEASTSSGLVVSVFPMNTGLTGDKPPSSFSFGSSAKGPVEVSFGVELTSTSEAKVSVFTSSTVESGKCVSSFFSSSCSLVSNFVSSFLVSKSSEEAKENEDPVLVLALLSPKFNPPNKEATSSLAEVGLENKEGLDSVVVVSLAAKAENGDGSEEAAAVLVFLAPKAENGEAFVSVEEVPKEENGEALESPDLAVLEPKAANGEELESAEPESPPKIDFLPSKLPNGEAPAVEVVEENADVVEPNTGLLPKAGPPPKAEEVLVED
ncbi:hypothetical protein WICPIJ_004647 [Wickerhamomyces pijperi]|uniref:Uncharacterized protein n=1 Tax=Wickerhamomyces pijperi TaxID=599730 RepID=A0A9P8Q5F4_WICPI|nr:hypothetical protein WICPIJ_004647 [Wickerhamomyces pijperi]